MTKLTAIVVDDEKMCRDNLTNLLQIYCPEISIIGIATSSVEAKHLVIDLEPDAVFLDINMPGPDGYKTANSIKNEPGSPTADIPIVFLTNTDLPIEMLKWMKDFGVTDYIHKGVTNEEFVEKINKIFTAKQGV